MNLKVLTYMPLRSFIHEKKIKSRFFFHLLGKKGGKNYSLVRMLTIELAQGINLRVFPFHGINKLFSFLISSHQHFNEIKKRKKLCFQFMYVMPFVYPQNVFSHT